MKSMIYVYKSRLLASNSLYTYQFHLIYDSLQLKTMLWQRLILWRINAWDLPVLCRIDALCRRHFVLKLRRCVVLCMFVCRSIACGAEGYQWTKRQIKTEMDRVRDQITNDSLGILCGCAICSGRHQRPPDRPQVCPGRWLPEGCLPARIA